MAPERSRPTLMKPNDSRLEHPPMHDDEAADQSPALANTRTMEIVVAALLLVGSAVVIVDSYRLGFGWQDDGPAPGFFPFWVAILLGGSSLVNLAQAIASRASARATFVSREGFGRILAVLVPSFVYVLAIGGLTIGPIAVPGLGIYVASCLFLSGFMMVIGRYGLMTAAAVGIVVPLIMFLLFEMWFLVPLPKGPLEAMLGLG